MPKKYEVTVSAVETAYRYYTATVEVEVADDFDEGDVESFVRDMAENDDIDWEIDNTKSYANEDDNEWEYDVVNIFPLQDEEED